MCIRIIRACRRQSALFIPVAPNALNQRDAARCAHQQMAIVEYLCRVYYGKTRAENSSLEQQRGADRNSGTFRESLEKKT